MAKHSVDVIVKARDDASRKFRTIGGAAMSMGSMIRKAAALAAVYFGARAVKRLAQESLSLYGRQEMAVKSLSDALDLIGKGGPGRVKDMEEFASSIQKITVYGDEMVLELAAMGAAMGKLHGEELKKATKAAIGLSKAYKIEVTAAMRLVSRARVGDTQTLARYGIKLKEGLNDQEKFNEVMRIGAENFKLAEGETKTYTGAVMQMKNALGDVKEAIGKGLMPVFLRWAKMIKQWAEDNKQRIGDWVSRMVIEIGFVKDVFRDFIHFMREDWVAGLKTAFDSTLVLFKAWGKSIWIIMEKVFGDLAINISTFMKRTGAQWLDYEVQLQKFIRQQRGKHIGGLYEKPLTFEIIEKAKSKAREAVEAAAKLGVYEVAFPTKELSTWETVNKKLITAWKDAFAEILEKAPPAFEEKLRMSMARREMGLTSLAMARMRGGAVPTGAGGGDGAGGAGEIIKALVSAARQTLRAEESRFLTFAPGTKFDYARQMAKDTKEQTKLERDMLRYQKDMVRELREGNRRPQGLPELAITAFA